MLTTEQRIERAVVKIMETPRYRWLSAALMVGNRTVSETVPTACTDGKNEYYGRAFVDSLRDAELRFLILHEVYHKILRHLIIWHWMYKLDPDLANRACDYVINVMLVDDNADGFATMTGPLAKGCYDDKYRSWDSARVFNDLRKNGGGKSGKGGNSTSDGSFDEHDWEAAQDMTADEQEELAREIDSAIRQGAMAAGKSGASSDLNIKAMLQVKVDWRDVLREFAMATCKGNDLSTWARPNRRFISAGYYRPTSYSETIGELVTGVDTSASQIPATDIARSLAEVAAIARTVNPSLLRLIYWDTEIRGEEVYTQYDLDKMADSTRPAGGGGTSVSCVTRHLQEKAITPQAAVIFTDGLLGGDWGNWDCPVLWVIIDNPRCTPPHGTFVHVEARDL